MTRRSRSGVFRQAVLVLRWFVDGTRVVQLARDNGISVPTAYRYLHEGLIVLADHAPDLSTVLERAAAAGYSHLNLDGTMSWGRPWMTTFKALRRVSLDPAAITRIARAALVLLQLEHGRTT